MIYIYLTTVVLIINNNNNDNNNNQKINKIAYRNGWKNL